MYIGSPDATIRKINRLEVTVLLGDKEDQRNFG